MRIAQRLHNSLRSAWENFDLVVVFLVALIVGALDVLNAVDGANAAGAILPVLAALAFAWLRDRSRSTKLSQQVAVVVAGTGDIRDLLSATEGTRTLTGSAISLELAEARLDTDRWLFKGGTGTYTRAVTLPECITISLRKRRPLEFRIEILDPTDDRLCTQYTQLHQELAAPGAEEKNWTAEGTRKDLYATILAACWYRERYRQILDLEVRLSGTMTLFRWDMSGSRLIITQRGPRFPAVVFTRDSPHYNLWRTELRTSLSQARRVPVEEATPLGVEPTAEEARLLFDALRLPLPAGYEDHDVAEIVTQALNHMDPYRDQVAAVSPGVPAQAAGGRG
ncbi:hypothetical protein OHA77_06590 [Streptosporangium sp. NBC_01639]|uniref:hypothetical protein n=1 Tax=Streptosporangium sp. NBC_01639 TaxID=2975948 RepID=UPI00386CBCCF|nr:hypothetical protein OHA77_06590 [Streptosporangium sp. NBC_01639]